mgnify:FL=1
MSTPTLEYGSTTNISATADVIATTDCTLIGFYVNSTSGGTLVLKKGGSSGTALCGTITPAIGFHRFPAACPGGLHATIAAAALNVTFFTVAGQA